VTEPPSQNVVGPSAVITGVGGAAMIVTTVGADVALQKLSSTTVTLYEPELSAVIEREVAPLDQRYDEPAEAVSVTSPPAQNVVGPEALMVGVATVLMFTVALFVATQPLLLTVRVTVIVPDVPAVKLKCG